MTAQTIRPSSGLANVKYEIRGNLARRAQEMERMGFDIISLNIGNPGAFGFRTPETMRLAMKLWMMRGLGFGCPFDVARAELATRLCVVRAVTSRLRAMGVRADQAAAEAVMMGELAAACEHWDDVVEAIANDPSPAQALTS